MSVKLASSRALLVEADRPLMVITEVTDGPLAAALSR